jgi:hypothetical protein
MTTNTRQLATELLDFGSTECVEWALDDAVPGLIEAATNRWEKETEGDITIIILQRIVDRLAEHYGTAQVLASVQAAIEKEKQA